MIIDYEHTVLGPVAVIFAQVKLNQGEVYKIALCAVSSLPLSFCSLCQPSRNVVKILGLPHTTQKLLLLLLITVVEGEKDNHW